MRKLICTWLVLGVGVLQTNGQTPDSSRWEFNAHANVYFIPDDVFFLPIFQADKNNLHLEARYNYEDRQTVSVWVGRNFSGGSSWEYTITPMIGGVTGRTDGISPGLEFTITHKRFELYTEGEYLFDLSGKENNFAYIWTDLTYSPKDWLFFGISGQRTRLYKTTLDIQRGFLIGFTHKALELTSYFYNLGVDPFFILTLSARF